MASFFVEYFTQRSAADRLARETADARTVRRTLALRARQKRDAAEALWAVSQAAEGLALMRDAVGLYREAVNQAGSGDTLPARLASLGIRQKAAARADRTLSSLAEQTLPVLDADVRSADSAKFRELGDVAATLEDAVADVVLVKREINMRRATRAAMAVVVLVVIASGLYFALRRTPPPPASASGVFGDDPAFTADHAIDGDPTTEWLLPDRTAGWLDVRVDPARAIHAVRLTNGHNRDYNDRAVRGYRLEAYDGDRLVAQASGEFAALVPHPVPIVVRLPAARADRVRVVVTSWFTFGSALAEVHVE